MDVLNIISLSLIASFFIAALVIAIRCPDIACNPGHGLSGDCDPYFDKLEYDSPFDLYY